jgi:uncharacterized membrane protein
MNDIPAPRGPVGRNIETIMRLEREALSRRSAIVLVGDAIAAFTGTAWFVFANAAFFAGWIWINRGGSAHVFDPYPYTLLTLVVSLEAIFLTAFVLMSQNEMARLADRRAQLDLQVNLLTEAEMTKVLQAIHAVARHLEADGVGQDEDIEELSQATDVEHLARQVARATDPAADRPISSE